MVIFGIDLSSWSRAARRNALQMAAVLVFFFTSGACGLLYQVVWTRKLALLFGTTSYAVSTVLSIFFIGLSVGSILGGRIADRTRQPLLAYGVCEVAIGIWALLLIATLDSAGPIVGVVLRTFGISRTAGIALRAALALVFLLAPVTLMGATLPLLAKWTASGQRLRGLRIGALYTVNTFGAVLGCAGAGFWALPVLGYSHATLLGAVANFGIGIVALGMGRGTRNGSITSTSTMGERDDLNAAASRAVPVVLLAFALSGFCALALEVLWTRLLVLVFVGTTYAFTTMLTTLLCGIALGSAVASAFVDRSRRPAWLFGLIEMLAGIACLLMLREFAGLPARLGQMQIDAGYHWEGIVRAKFVLSFLVLFVPTFLFGMTFPIAVKALTSSGPGLGREMGRLYSANTFGGVVGALAGGFLLIPVLGAHWGIVACSCILLVVGGVLVLTCPGLGRIYKTASVAAGALLAVGSFHAAPADVSLALNDGYIPKDHRTLFYREGIEGTVAVSEPAENATASDRILWINAVQATASIEKGIKMNRFEGVLPLVFDRDPQTALFMCFGSGITAGTLGLSDFQRIDAVEIAREVLDAAHLFTPDNRDVLNNPKIRFIVDDGRNYLLTTRQRYDVITFEPMPLALAGVSTFYTSEYYRLCLEHLTPGGLVSQWVPLHSLDPDLVRSLIRTFTGVFPEYCAWFVNADLFLVGSNQPLHIDCARLSRRLAEPSLRDALKPVGLADMTELIACFFMGKQQIDTFVQGGTAMTDDRPWAEFIAPKLMFERTVDKSLDLLAPHFESPAALLSLGGLSDAQRATILQNVDRRYRARVKNLQGLSLYYGGSFGSQPEVFFKEALKIDPDDSSSRYYLKEILVARANTLVRWKKPDEAIAALFDALKYAPDLLDLRLLLADIYFDQHDVDSARRNYETYIALGGKAPRALERTQTPAPSN